jgi:dynein heavy chain
MVTLAGTAIWWTWFIEDVFRKVAAGNKHAMKDESAKETNQLQDVIGVIRDT